MKRDIGPTIVFVSHTHAGGNFRVGSHHLAREFSKLGYRVAHVSTPYSASHALLRKGAEGRREQAIDGAFVDGDGVTQVVPRTLLPAQFSNSRYLLRLLKDLGFAGPDFMLIDQPLMVSAQLRSSARTIIYRPTDLYETGIAARKQSLALSMADGVVATSAEVLRSLDVPSALPATFIPNGVELSRFSASASGARSGAIYVGALDDRFDWDAIRAIAHAAPHARVQLAGPIVSELPLLPDNVEILGPVAYEEVPRLLSGAKVGLLPFSDHPSNRGRSPMKLYEYLASGLFVVSRATPVIDSYDLPGVHTYDDARQSGELFARLMSKTEPNVAGVTAATGQDWSSKALEVEAFMQRIASR